MNYAYIDGKPSILKLALADLLGVNIAPEAFIAPDQQIRWACNVLGLEYSPIPERSLPPRPRIVAIRPAMKCWMFLEFYPRESGRWIWRCG